MGRQYTTEHYLERLDRIREAVPGITISTDVIVGFCGETEAQFQARSALLETVRYDQVFAAAYSQRPGTPATRLADDVPPAVKRRRLNELLAAPGADRLERNRAWLGRDVEVLVDRSPRRARTTTTTTPPRSARRRVGTARARTSCPAGHAATSSSTLAGVVLLGREVASGSSMRGRTRCEVVSFWRNRPPLVDIVENAPFQW